jgi:GNAT superfamily N-acetyltransferase
MTLDRELEFAVGLAPAAVTCRPAGPDDGGSVLRLYEEWGYGGGIAAGDVLRVLDAGSCVVGVVRLTREHAHTVLRGMYVSPAWRGRGLGRLLLRDSVAQLGGDAYCLPYAHLEGFCRQAGFESCPDTDAPAFLRDRVAAYRWTGKSYLIMRRKHIRD